MISESRTLYTEESLHPTVEAFHSITKKYLFFHAAFIALATIEASLVLLFFSSLVDSFILGISIAILFFTALLYFILRLYTNDQKPEEFRNLVELSLTQAEPSKTESAKKNSKTPRVATPHAFLATASLAKNIALELEQSGAPSYPIFEKLTNRSSILQQWLLQLHKQDIFHIKEMFLVAAHEQLRASIALDPLNPNGHALLGKNFLDLAALAEKQKKFDFYKRAIQGAIEEFTIVDAYHPGDTETHRELAFCYRSLKKTVQEIQEFEKIVALESDDTSALFTLGVLYFRTGEKAKGLQVYEKLRNELPEKAAELMQYY